MGMNVNLTPELETLVRRKVASLHLGQRSGARSAAAAGDAAADGPSAR
jgi:hypothetical protein